MRTRSRLLAAFLAVYLVLAVATGTAVMSVMAVTLRTQAVSQVGAVLAAGGFSLSDPVLARMQDLTGYRLQRAGSGPPPAGWIRVEHAGVALDVDYRSPAHQRLIHTVLISTGIALVAGVLAFAVVAWWLARQFAQPLERLATAARAIGTGALDAAVPAVGSGEVAALAADLEQMRLRLIELDRQRRQAERLATLGLFTATIAHEVRNPLTAVRLTMQLLAKRLPNDAGVTLISEELERLDLTIDELLAFSRGITVHPERCELRPLAEHVVRLLRRQAEHHSVTLTISGDATLNVDPARLRQVLLNLVLNAIQAQREGGDVTIELRPDGLAVIDRGPGVDPALVPQLFEAFASGKPEGTGLGLHLAHAIVTAHGATLRYEARAPGCAFVISVPALNPRS